MPFLARQALCAFALGAALAWSAPAFAQAPNAPAARAVVDGFHAVLLDVMKRAKELGLKGRYERLEPEIARRFNLRLMAAIASGAAWAKAGETERAQLTAAFGRFSTANYAARFDSWSGQSFETLSAGPGPRGTMMVTTRINRPNESPVKIAYVLRSENDAWRIVDVLVDDGISELAVRRSDYASILASRGIAGLIGEIDKRTEKLMQP